MWPRHLWGWIGPFETDRSDEDAATAELLAISLAERQAKVIPRPDVRRHKTA
jgi:hypothetical protein